MLKTKSSRKHNEVMLQQPLTAGVAPWEEDWGTCPPTSRQDRYSNSSKFDEKMSWFGRVIFSKILKRLWQSNCVITLA